MTRPGTSLLLVCAVACVLLAARATAGPPGSLLDQEFLTGGSISYSQDYVGDFLAQTFTVNAGGQLTGVDVQVFLGGYPNYLPPVDDLHLKLVRTDAAGVPLIGDVLASATISWLD